MQYGGIRFDTELKILRGFIQLRKHGVRAHELEEELLKLGPVDLDLMYAVLDKLSFRIRPTLPDNLPAASAAQQVQNKTVGVLGTLFGL